ncbi:MAG: dTMP kinase [Ignavibacteriaceae bacterium]|jgi:dTMP kinase
MFITFEGIDFSGKSTQVELLYKYLLKKGSKVEIIREPGGTEISEIVRTILLDKSHNKMTMEAEIFLFSASRAQLVREKIRPYLKKGIYVILDRFHDSTIAYQGFGRGIPLDSVVHINKLAIGETIPDLTFFLDIQVKEADRRKKLHNREELDRIEVSSSEFYEKVRKGYLYLAEHESRFRVLDGTLKEEDIHKKIIEELVLYEH